MLRIGLGTCLIGCGLALAMVGPYSAHAKTTESARHGAIHKSAASNERIVYAFTGGADGANPAASLVADNAGNLYGTAGFGGDSSCRLTSHHFIDHRVEQNPGCGILFRLSTAGGETTLHTFTGDKDGAGPPGALYNGAGGNLFGVTAEGGGKKSACRRGCGTVFELKSDGSEKLLYAFVGGNDGVSPDGTLTADASGNFYGTTGDGGSYACGAGNQLGCGTVFELTPGGSESILHAFSDPRSDGVYPGGTLVVDKAGNVYGLTAAGGSDSDCGLGAEGCGVLFEISAGAVESILHRFTGGSDGAYPTGNLVTDGAGTMVFTTMGGGSDTDCGLGPYGCGVLFRFAKGTLTVLHIFKGGSDGAYPIGSLLLDGSGNVFGTTGGGGSTKNCGLGGAFGCGTLFEVSAGGSETVLHAFKGGRNDGAYPTSGLFALNNHLYGTTATGGTGCGKAGCGTVFEVKE
ncbi:MAG TPA: choice-of-anchor tandem repeat GloVer-containing protein [Rhizomicrobium sp.]|nr:choice-of-anchor tandem repeat GloVer-containing protein [Rhizomicrobium sp.]